MGIIGAGGHWSPLMKYQYDLVDAWQTVVVAKWGRGTGKSAALLLKAISGSIDWPGMQTTYVAPVSLIFQQAVYTKLRAWDHKIIRDRGHSLIRNWNEQKGTLRFINGSEIHFRTATNVDHIRGGDNGLIVIEEGQMVDGHEDALASLMPSLRGIGPGTLAIGGTPDGDTGILGAMCLLAGYQQDAEADDHESHIEVDGERVTFRISRRTTMDNKYFPKVTLALAKATMTPERFAEEMCGRGRKPSHLVYPEFDETTHVARVPLRQLMMPYSDWRVVPVVDWGFSKAHVSWFLIRQGRGEPSPTVILYREAPLDRNGHIEIIRMIADQINHDPSFPRALVVDPEGGSTGRGQEKYAENRAAIAFFRPLGIPVIFEKNKAKRGITSTADLVRRLLKTADGKQRFWIAKEVADQSYSKKGGRGTLPSFQAYGLQEIGASGNYRDKPKDDNKTTHSMDCVRMLCICAPKLGYNFMGGIPAQVEKFQRDWRLK